MAWRRNLILPLAQVALWPAMAMAEEAPLPDFETCLRGEILRYEQAVDAFAPTPAEKAGYPLANVNGVEFCGTIGIVICDRSEEPLGCQKALAVEQDIWRARVLTELPEPKDAEGAEVEKPFAEVLYEQLFHLAHGMSAGQDCAGHSPRMAISTCFTLKPRGTRKSLAFGLVLLSKSVIRPHSSHRKCAWSSMFGQYRMADRSKFTCFTKSHFTSASRQL